MSQIVTVPKKNGSQEPNGIVPDTTSKYWRMISETDTTMTIEILD